MLDGIPSCPYVAFSYHCLSFYSPDWILSQHLIFKLIDPISVYSELLVNPSKEFSLLIIYFLTSQLPSGSFLFLSPPHPAPTSGFLRQGLILQPSAGTLTHTHRHTLCPPPSTNPCLSPPRWGYRHEAAVSISSLWIFSFCSYTSFLVFSFLGGFPHSFSLLQPAPG